VAIIRSRTTIQANVSDYLARLAAEVAEKEKTTLDQIIALALSAQLSAWKVRDEMATSARRARAEDLREVLTQVPDAPPVPGDEK
jgi:hypothetical protein